MYYYNVKIFNFESFSWNLKFYNFECREQMHTVHKKGTMGDIGKPIFENFNIFKIFFYVIMWKLPKKLIIIFNKVIVLASGMVNNWQHVPLLNNNNVITIIW